MQQDPPAGTRRQGIPCRLVSWETFNALSLQLARRLRGDHFQPELIVAIARGGYLPARILSDYLDVFDLASVKVEHYRGVHKEAIARVRYPLTAAITGRRVLLVDDVSDSGDSFEVALHHLRRHGEPAALRTAALHHKQVSTFVPDYYAEEIVEWRWIVYPWARYEDLGSFLRSMEPPPNSVDEFAAQLRERHDIRVDRPTLEDVMALAASRRER
jgi:hypoxanthine phosphoribosyltransferase